MARIELSNIGSGGGTTLSLTTTGTSGASTLVGSTLNIPIYQGALTLSTSGTSGASTLVGNTLTIPTYQGALTLTTTGTSGAATLVGSTLNIPQYSGGSPAGSTGEIQYNNAGAFAASANLAWDNTNIRLNVGAPSAPTGKLNVKGSGTLTTVNTILTNSGNTELLKVLDNGNTNIGTGFNWDNINRRLGIGTSSPSELLDIIDTRTGYPYTISAKSSNSTSRCAIYLKNNNDEGFIMQAAGTTYGGGIYQNAAALFAQGSGLTKMIIATNGDISTGGSTPIWFMPGGQSVSPCMILTPGNRGNVIIGADAGNGRLTIRGSNASSGTNALLVQNSTPDDIYKIENNGKISYLATNTAAGTTGAQTINRPSGTVNFAAGATSLVVTNSLCTTASIVLPVIRTNDATATIKNVVPAAGSFTINLGAAATAETSVGFFIIN